MGATFWAQPLPPFNFADGTPNATTSLADISPGGTTSQKTVYAGQSQLGSHFIMRAQGEYTCGSTATNLLIGFYYGGAAAGAAGSLAGTTAAMTVSQTSVPWWMEYEGEIRQLGTSGTIKGSGNLRLSSSLTAWTPIPIPATLAARTVTIDTTTNKIITVAASVSQTTGGPTVTCYSMSLMLLP